MTDLTTIEQSRLAALEATITAGQVTFVAVAAALSEIRDTKLYRANYPTFDAYCRQKWGWSRIHAHRLIEAGQTVSALPAGNKVKTESQARVLASVPPAQQNKVLAQAAAAAESEARPMTARHIQAAKATLPPPQPDPPPPPPQKPLTAPPPPPLGVTDGVGRELPASVMPLWNRADEVRQLLQSISSVRTVLKHAQDDRDPLYRGLDFNSLSADLNNAYRTLATAVPFAVCPTCQGHAKKSCDLCNGNGLISKFRWNTNVSREEKDLIAATVKARSRQSK